MTRYQVLFDSGSFQVNAAGQAVINQFVIDWKSDGKPLKVLLSCQTDRVGSDDSNFLLSHKRCESVQIAIAEAARKVGRRYFVISSPRGELELVAPTADDVPHPANRVVIIMILDYYAGG